MRNKFVMAAALFAAIGIVNVGCYGPFNLTRRLHKWNGEVGTKWVQEGVFLAFIILPVYGIATLADAIVFNSIQFWTGNNPVKSAEGGKEIRHLAAGTDKVLMSYSARERILEIQTSKNGESRYVRLEPQADGSMAAKDRKGKTFMVSRVAADGGIQIENTSGGLIAKYSSEQAEKVLK